MRKASLLAITVLALCLALSPAIASAQPASAQLIQVGTSSLCDYHTISAALAAAQPGDTIKVEEGVFAESPLLADQDVTLAGGYMSADPYGCLTLTGVGWTTVHRTGTVPNAVLTVHNATVRVTWFILEQNAYGSGLSATDGDVTLEHVIVTGNDALHGGGIHATRARVTLLDSEVSENSADLGGGLYLWDSSAAVAERSLVRANQGFDRGAGVYLLAGSTFTALDGTSIESNVTPLGCDYGGGIWARGAGTEVLLDASHVVDNTALLQGGGIYLSDGAQATLRNLAQVRQNRAFGPASGAGGGVYLTGAGTLLTLSPAAIMDNWADPVGGGIASYGGTVRMVDSLVSGNSARDAGGGIYNQDGELSIRTSLVVDNEVTAGDGGGVFSTGAGGALDIVASWLIYNRAPASDGAGLYASHPLVTIERSSLSNNVALGDGSGLFLTGACCAGASAQVVNNIFLDNSQAAPARSGPPAGGSTLYVEDMQVALVHNTLALVSPQATFGVYVGPDAQIDLTNNILVNYYIGIRRVSTGTGMAWADHTLFYGNTYDVDPGVISTNEVHGDPLFTADRYHLGPGSAAIDAGVAAGITADFDSALRPWGPGYDIGADEYPPRVSRYLPLVQRQ